MSIATDYKHQLIETLCQLPSMQSFDIRTNLLEELPSAFLTSRVASNARDDLLQIFNYALAAGRTDQGIPAIEILHRNIMRYVPSHTELAIKIEELFEGLLHLNEKPRTDPSDVTYPKPRVETPAVFISYAWGKDLELIVDQIDESFQRRGIIICRDKREVGYKKSIKKFMEQIGQGDCVIVVISDKYLRSPNCMFELVEIAKNNEFHERVFPVVLGDADIYKPVKQLKYVKYWEKEINSIKKGIKGVDPTKLQGIYEKLDLYDDIRDHISRLIAILSDMNTLKPEMHRDSDFSQLYEAVEKRIEWQMDSGGK